MVQKIRTTEIDNGGFIGDSVGRGSNKEDCLVNLTLKYCPSALQIPRNLDHLIASNILILDYASYITYEMKISFAKRLNKCKICIIITCIGVSL